jgi:hypothetical protein
MLLEKAQTWTTMVSEGKLEVVVHNGHIRVQRTSLDTSSEALLLGLSPLTPVSFCSCFGAGDD